MHIMQSCEGNSTRLALESIIADKKTSRDRIPAMATLGGTLSIPRQPGDSVFLKKKVLKKLKKIKKSNTQPSMTPVADRRLARA